ncbi:hypothetical protein CONLIGDRAFT_377378 [Coniochaeta ligniaria NRRL 30616]|uniref:PCI domain-containing protein n=1 Tax=Coniochaeta ligniaria NRRL 30616 TaxID=1408157 RepID=A0A1J7JL77_9PEZI|nr:hypothetical protein CONLIGDRAFT_377378 [Coniochaeta ligniaria NRRL 30616]
MALVTQFLTGVRKYVIAADDENLAQWLRVEPPVPDIYYKLRSELQSSFPPNRDSLSKLIDRCLPEEDDVPEGKGSPWPGLNSFINEYMEYWRDVDFNDAVKLYTQLSNLLNSCANALANPTYGSILLKTSMSISKSLCKLVMNLMKQPELMAQIKRATTDEGERKSIAESAADIIQKIFTSCLLDRSSARWDKPKGKKAGVYLFANLVLKLLISCYKSRLAVQMLTNIDKTGPALSLFPASQRVTYLYHLGRLYLNVQHFVRASLCFEAAYAQCPARFLSHRRQIVVYWIPTSLLLGRFPSALLLSRPEARGLDAIYLPICRAIRSGDFLAYYAAMAAARPWLQKRGVYPFVFERLKTLVWRSLTRKTFILTYTGHASTGGGARAAAPVLQLADLLTVATYIQRRLEGWEPAPTPRGKPHPPPQVNSLFMRAVANSSAGQEAGTTTTLVPPPGGKTRRLAMSEGLNFGNRAVTMDCVMGVVAGLVGMGLLNGFISYSQEKFAVEGTKRAGGDAVAAGWPGVWRVGTERWSEGPDGESGGVDWRRVPAWVRDEEG